MRPQVWWNNEQKGLNIFLTALAKKKDLSSTITTAASLITTLYWGSRTGPYCKFNAFETTFNVKLKLKLKFM